MTTVNTSNMYGRGAWGDIGITLPCKHRRIKPTYYPNGERKTGIIQCVECETLGDISFSSGHIYWRNNMNHIMREELIALLSAVPEKTMFQLGTPPMGAERTLSLQVFTQLSSSDAERVQQIARQLPSLTPEKIGATPDPINPPLSKEDLETLEAIRSGKAKLVLMPQEEAGAPLGTPLFLGKLAPQEDPKPTP